MAQKEIYDAYKTLGQMATDAQAIANRLCKKLSKNKYEGVPLDATQLLRKAEELASQISKIEELKKPAT